MPRVAVYGTFRKGLERHIALASSPFLGECRLPGYVMFDHGGEYPYVMVGEGSIQIEVYEADEHTLIRMDVIEGAPVLYGRKGIVMGDEPAWLYARDKKMDEGDECITSGDWRVHTEGIAHLSRAVSIFDSPTGPIRVTMAGDVLVRLELEPENPGEGEPPPRVARELKEYFSGERKAFDIPYNMEGTPFQLAVWDALAQIPYGETRTYGEVAKSIGKPGAMRAVGTAAGKNHLPIIIPCHRVVAANGMGGFSAGLWRKDWLLTLEGRRG